MPKPKRTRHDILTATELAEELSTLLEQITQVAGMYETAGRTRDADALDAARHRIETDVIPW